MEIVLDYESALNVEAVFFWCWGGHHGASLTNVILSSLIYISASHVHAYYSLLYVKTWVKWNTVSNIVPINYLTY